MAGPWEKYQATAPAADGPWAKYQSQASTAGPWEKYQANNSPENSARTDSDKEDDGILSSAVNTAKGVGERAAKNAGTLVRFAATSAEPVADWLQRNVGDFIQEPDGSTSFRRYTEEEAAKPSGALLASQSLAKKLESVDLGYKQGTSWEDFKNDPLRNFIPFALEQGLVSTPDMLAAVYALPAYIAARTGEMGQERAKNNGLDNATVEDLLTVLPASVASSMMERIGAKGILSETAVTAAKELPKAIGKAALKEGLTEGAQEGVEYTATNAGTKAGFDPATGLERMAAGAVGGIGFGGMARAAGASVEVAKGERGGAEVDAGNRAVDATTPATPNADSADVLYGPDPDIKPDTPVQRQAVERMAPVDPDRAHSPRLTPEDRSSPLPNDLIDDGKAIIDSATSEKPQGASQASDSAVASDDAVLRPDVSPALPAAETATISASLPSATPEQTLARATLLEAGETNETIDSMSQDEVAATMEQARSSRITPSAEAIQAATDYESQRAIVAPKPTIDSAESIVSELPANRPDVNQPESTQAPIASEAATPEPVIQPTVPATPIPAPIEAASAKPVTKAPSRPAAQRTVDGFPADRSGRIKKPKSIIEFLAERGGIRDQNGDLKAIGLKGGKDSFVGGVGSLIRKGGMTLDHARKIALEAGYLSDPGAGANRPSESYVSDLLNAIEEDVRSGRQKFSTADADYAMRWNEQQQAMQDADRYGGEEEFRLKTAMDEVMKLTGSKGDDPVSMDIAKMMAQDGVDFDTAAIAIERRAEQNFAERGLNAKLEPVPSLRDLPFFGDENNSAFTARTTDDGRFADEASADANAGAVHEGGSGDRSAGDQGKGPGSERGTASASRAGSGTRPAQADDGKRASEPRSREVTAEAGADGKPQLVIPGAEKASQKDQAQRKADAKLKPRAPQQEVGGMFGDDVNSPELFDKAPKTGEPKQDKPRPKAKKSVAGQIDRYANYFRAGRDVAAYGSTKDRVIRFNRTGKDGWNVTVAEVNRDGSLGRERTHSTPPSERELQGWEKTNPTPVKAPLEGRRIDKEWSEFSKASGTLGVPRAEMPQIKAEHRGAMVNFLNARGIDHREETVPADSLIPTQKEFSRDKVAKAKAFEGGDRSILVANDDHILDGHHQWLAKREAGDDIKVIRLDAPIRRLMTAVNEFPSSTQEGEGKGGRRPIENTEAFKRWFGDSKVVDKDGNPLVVYHGSLSSVDAFRPSKDLAGNVRGSYFTPDASVASLYATGTSGGNVTPAYLHIERMLTVDFKGKAAAPDGRGREEVVREAKRSGYDGVLLKDTLDTGSRHDQYAVFSPNQIKSVNNRGTFNPEDDRILFQKSTDSGREVDTFPAEFMSALAEHDDVFQYPRSEATSLKGVFKEIDPTVRYVGEVDLDQEDNANDASRKFLLRSANGDDFYVYERDGEGGDKSEVWIDVSRLKEGGGGSGIYAAVANYAYNTGKVFIGDPAGLSDVALRRRTDAMLSSALKFGTTEHLAPHPRQLDGDEKLGVPPLKWTEGDDLGNVQSMIDASVASSHSVLPEIARARYDFKDGTFRSSKGERISDGMFLSWASAPRMRAASLGRSTAKRSILLNTLSRAESGERPVLLGRILRQSRQHLTRDALGRILYDAPSSLSESFVSDLDTVTADLRERLDKLGLKDVALRIAPVIEGFANGETFKADGSYFKNLIEVSLASPDKLSTLNHEAIHALRDLKAFTKSEWSMLAAKSKADWVGRFGIDKAYANSPKEVQVEEGIAAAYADWAKGRQPSGTFARLFQRIKDVVASIGNALRGAGFDSVGKIFRRVESGDVGSRGLFKTDGAATGEKRFQLTRDPADQAESKEVMQGFIGRGQPIDRAIRLPFEVLGGINKDGTWKPALKVNDKLGNAGRSGMGLGGIIGAGIGGVAGGPIGAAVGGVAGATAGVALLRAKISPNGKFGWLYPVAENARRGLIDRYGLSEEYLAADRGRQTSQRGILQKAQDILQVLQNASVGPAEAKVLQAVLTGENVTDTEMLKVAAPIRKAIDELGAEAVSLGLISAESFERNRGAYLHRVYQKNEMDQGGVIAWGSKFMAKKRTRILGDELKGRGIFWDVPLDKLMVDVPGWLEGSTGVPANGQRFKVLDYVGGKTTDLISGEEKDGPVQRRVYLPADQPTPKKFQGSNWMDRGDWEVRKTGQKVTLWRDYTKEERAKMGEILDARYTIAKTFMLMANDLSTGRFYKQVSENEDWAQRQPPAMEWREAADYGRFWSDPNIGWVRVPETTIANSGGKKRYGALSGMFVRAEIWRDLNEVDQMSKPGIWKTMLAQWKVNKTARSPVTHMNNVMSNLMFMDLADVRFQDLSAGIKSFMQGDGEYMAARDAGAFGSDMIAQEIRKDVLQPILDEIAKVGSDGKNPLLARMGALGTVSDKIWTWAKAADDRMLQAYQMEDEVFRMATYLRRRSLGDSVETAASHAREQFLDYDIRAPWVNAARNSVLPFISYSYRAIPKVSENVMNRPWKVAKYFAIAYAANMLAYMWDDGDDGEDRERASLRDEEQGYTWFGIPRMMRMPYRDADGMPVFLDVRRWIPSGDVFDTNQGQSAIPVPAPLQLGGPLLLAFEFALNKQSFTGAQITNELTDTAGDKAAKVGDWLWKSWMPSAAWVPNSWYWEKISNAINGAEDYSGRKYSLKEAALSSIGIKLKPQNVEDGLGWKQRAFHEVERALRSEARRLANNRQRGLISDAEFNRGMSSLMEKFTNLGKKAEELGQQAKKKTATR